MIIDFKTAKAKKVSQKVKCHYIITISEDEEPAYVTAELQKGIITVIINARTPNEAEQLWKQGEATRLQAQQQ